ELARIAKLQQESRSQVGGLEIQARDVGRLTKPDLDHLQGAELTKRQVDRGLVSPEEGVTSQIDGLLADLKNNKVDSPDIERRMRSVRDEVARLAKEHLPAIGQSLTSAIKASQGDAETEPPAEGKKE